ILAVNSKLFVAAPLAFTLIVGTGVIARSHRNDDDVKPAPQPPRVAPAPKAETVPPKPATVETPPPPAVQAEEPKRPVKEAKAARRPKDAAAKPAVQSPRASETEATTSTAAKPETVAALAPVAPAAREATVNIIALPWAEVFIDGTRQGVSPPL